MLRIVVDGSCRGNPGPMGWAAVLTRDGEILKEVTGGSQDTGTNNIAEFQAILCGLKAAEALLAEDVPDGLSGPAPADAEPAAAPLLAKDETITVVSDSELCIGYLMSNWRSKNVTLGRLRLQVRSVEKILGVSVTYEKGGIEDELFQLVDTMAKDAVPISHEEQRRNELVASVMANETS